MRLFKRKNPINHVDHARCAVCRKIDHTSDMSTVSATQLQEYDRVKHEPVIFIEPDGSKCVIESAGRYRPYENGLVCSSCRKESFALCDCRDTWIVSKKLKEDFQKAKDKAYSEVSASNKEPADE